MAAMKDFFAQYYGTGAATATNGEQLEKNAQMELFCKLAASNNIDLEKLSEQEIQFLWQETFKGAEEEPKPEEKKPEHLEEKAKEEHEKKKEAAAKVAEADFLGRTMAHSMVDELKKLAAEGQGIPSIAAPALPAATDATKEAAMPEALAKGLAKVRSHAGKASDAVGKHMEHTGRKLIGVAKGGMEHSHDASKRHAQGLGGAAHAAGAAALGGAAAAAHHHLKKEGAAALDVLAGEIAVEKAASAGFDPEEAGERIAAVLTLGPGESEKIASVRDIEAAKDIRAIELLELAGYPITWTPNT